MRELVANIIGGGKSAWLLCRNPFFVFKVASPLDIKLSDREAMCISTVYRFPSLVLCQTSIERRE